MAKLIFDVGEAFALLEQQTGEGCRRSWNLTRLMPAAVSAL